MSEAIDVTNAADAAAWLMQEIGRGPLAGMFLRGDQVVHTPRVGAEGYRPPARDGDDDGPAQVQILDQHRLAARISTEYAPYRVTRNGKSAALFPTSAARTVLAVTDRALNLRPLRGVVHTPVPRADGTLVRTPGYDPSTGLLLLPEVDVPAVPEHPSTEDVSAAVALLRELLAGFVWAGEHDEANFLGLLLTPLLRELAPGPYPLGAIMARQPGSGKTLLASVLRTVHGGVFRSEMPGDDAELGKSVTSILTVTTAPVVTFDNVTGTLRSSRLAGLLTSRDYTDRPLGSTAHVSALNDRVWTITGNNLALGGDLVRRAVWVTIDPRVPDPQRRTGFAIPDLVGHVERYRAEILAALLVLVAAWRDVGSPAQVTSSDCYARWRAVVRGILATAGVPGTFDHDDSRMQAVGTDDEGWSDFCAAARDAFGDRAWTARELLARMDDLTLQEKSQATTPPRISRDVLPDELHERLERSGGQPSRVLARPLGKWLQNRDGRFAGEHVCRNAGRDRSNVRLWKVETAGGDR